MYLDSQKTRYKTSQSLFKVTNKIQKLFSILTNRSILSNYLELDCSSLLNDLLSDSLESVPKYLTLNTAKMTAHLAGGVTSGTDRRLSIVRLQNILRHV